ncbi:hypothetical protein [Gracilibacillus salinarum]|uniref:Lipoprotein n=1 Tax=Gracilibacillus salinarum TaxID=2932255 RepID=A0ABY4GMX4_9BACI|nr:hypothetical protein [Gracilibacillus salinarum]UOQ85546.1 hypothetical protein MUN87_01175 [Gracilibacillus salinarum]
MLKFLKKQIILTILVSTALVLSACQSEKYQEEFVEWADTINSDLLIERLEDNDIPYKIENDKILIPDDAKDDAVDCCS